MQYRGIIKTAVFWMAALLLSGLLTGCSAAFAGFPLGGKEELQFICNTPGGGDVDAALVEEQTAVLTAVSPESDDSGEAVKMTSETAEGTGERELKSGETVPAENAEGITADGRVDLNKAGLEELMTLNGIGETRAQAIIDYRTRQGAFTRIEDIMQIPGIKEGIFSKIRDEIVVQ